MRPRKLPALFVVTALLVLPWSARSQEKPEKKSTLKAADSVALLDKAEDLLRTGDWSQGKEQVAAAIANLLGSPLEGDGGRAILGRALALRAIASVGSGEAAAAEFDALEVASFGFDPATLDLASFGKAGDVFRDAANRLASTAEPLKVGGGISRPQILTKVNPTYSYGTREERIQGVSIVQVAIDETGRVTRPNLLHSLHPQLDFAAFEAVREWKFEPAKLEGKPVAAYYVLTINFRLE